MHSRTGSEDTHTVHRGLEMAWGGGCASQWGLCTQPCPVVSLDVQLYHRAGSTSKERQLGKTTAAATERRGEAHEEQ